MKLRFSSASPYVRKVLLIAHEVGLEKRIDIVPTNPWAADTDLATDNPLGKIPALVTDEGQGLYDSSVICEYLDSLHDKARLFPIAGPRRWTALRRQALADGALDAAILIRVETVNRPAPLQWPDWIARQSDIIDRTLDTLEHEAADFADDLSSIGEITVLCALGFLDFRFPERTWRTTRPKLAAWFAQISLRPSAIATAPWI